MYVYFAETETCYSLYLWMFYCGNHSDNCRIILGPKHVLTSPSRVKDFDEFKL